MIPYLQEKLKPIRQYCDWLSTFGDWDVNAKYLPHISLRYLGFTDELDKEKLLFDRNKFTAGRSYRRDRSRCDPRAGNVNATC